MSVTNHPIKPHAVDRRSAAVHGVSATMAAVLSSTLAVGQAANAASVTESSFVGTYADPINHPGGKRTIRVVGNKIGDYQLAEVVGGGGRGEPANYVLPAVVIGDRSIIIDFSVPPKNGPKDLTGVLDGNKGIRFLRDGNVWPRLEE